MKLNDWILTLIIIIAFSLSISYQSLSVSLEAIRSEWPKHRCNPVFMPFASQFGENTMTNFTQCTQNVVKDIAGYILKPMEYSMSLLGTLGSRFENSLNYVRKMIDKIRNLATAVFGQIYGVFLNILIEFQQMIIAIKDMVGKIMGVMMTFMYMLDGSVKTMQSVWRGPPGQLLRGLCFHPSTKIKLNNGKVIDIKDVEHGDVLKNGQIVYATMKIKNDSIKDYTYISDLYEFDNSDILSNDKKILVSGSHLVKCDEEFIQVYQHPDARPSTINSKTLICLITNDHTIPIGEYIFGDWEDNGVLPWELEHKEKNKKD